MKKIRKFQTGGVSNPSFREEKQKAIENKKIERESKAQAQKEAMAQRAYKQAVADYERDLRLDPEDTNPFGYGVRKLGDQAGDKLRSVGKFFGSNKMTSMDDEAQMQARKDVKGYKKGGMAKKPAKKMMGGGMYAKGGGIEVKGKTKGKIIKMAKGGGIEIKGKTKGKMITMKSGGKAC